MKRLIPLSLLLLPLSSNAEFSIAGGQEFIHDDRVDEQSFELRYFGEEWKHWTAYIGNNNTIGGDLYYTNGSVEYGFGIEYADELELVGTNMAYQLRIDYNINEDWSVGVKHRSNCKDVCRNVPGLSWLPKGPEDESNTGYNFLMVRYKF